MYVRMLNFETNDKPAVTKIMDVMVPRIKAQKGCKGCLFIMHEADGKYALIVYWDSVENANAAAPIIGGEMLPQLNKITRAPIVPVLYEVYQPTT